MARPPVKKEAIERSALELFAEVGIDGTSIRMIAERAGVTEGALYRHHDSKDDLVKALFFAAFERFGLLLKAAHEGQSTVDQQLRQMVSGFYTAYDDDPKAFQFVLLVQHQLLDDVRADLPNPIEIIMEVIQRAIDRKEIPPQNVALMAQLLLGAVMQAAVGHRYGRVAGPLRSHTAPVVDSCLRMLGWRGELGAGKA